MKDKKIIITIVFCLSVLILGESAIAAEFMYLERRPYRFDAGGITSETAVGAVRVTPTDIYKRHIGFGWTVPPEKAFMREELTRSRTAFTIDGVQSAKRLAFRADLPPGDWWLTLWMEAGTEDSSTVSLFVGETSRLLGWHPFLPSAEPRKRLQKIYRLYHGRVSVNSEGLCFQLIAGRDSIRVLGFTLTPDPQSTTEAHQDLLRRLQKTGRYGSPASFNSLQTDLENILAHHPADLFATYWLEQVQLLALAERYLNMMGWEWATNQTGLGIFDRYHQAVMIFDGLLNRSDREDYPLYERALWQRGRLLYWLGLERHGPNEMAGGKRDLSQLYMLYPGDSLLAMYNGEKIDTLDPCDALERTPGAPAWSTAQREVLCRLRALVHWWVNERQALNGEFGGKLGDDVELLRWWVPVILAGDTVALQGWRRLADCVWQSPKVYQGYSKRAIDVEHAAEFIADTAPAMAIYSDDPEYTHRLRPSARYFETLWTEKTLAGNRFFRSAWFSSTEVKTEPPKNRDLEYNTRAVKAIRYLAWKTGDPKVIRLLHEWSQAWVRAANRTDKGKPKGLIPASVRFPDEAINGDEPTWYKANMFWPYYDWDAHVGSMMLDQLLFTYTLTGDEDLLQPLMAALDLVKAHEAANTFSSNREFLEPGSSVWAATKLRKNDAFWSVVEQWRLVTGDTRYDELMLRYGTPYARFRLTGDERYLLNGLQQLLESVRYNTPMLTSEVLHTDRVYAPGADHLKAMLTGDGMPESMSPYYAVSWEGTDDTFTALVTETRSDRLGVQVFSHAEAERTINIRLWQLDPGSYRIKRQAEGKHTEESTVIVKGRGQRISILLPPRRLLTLMFERM